MLNTTPKENYIIVEDKEAQPADWANFVEKEAYQALKDHHLVINLLACPEFSAEDMTCFLPLSERHRKHKKSFVVVSNDVSISDVPQELIVVPTLREAEDVIQMEEIERDLDVF